MKYTAVSVVTLPEGAVLELSEQQAAARKHALLPVGKGRYKTSAPVQFKTGEVFGYEGELPKVIASELEPVETQRKRKAAAETAEAERRAADLAARRQELEQHIAALEEAHGKAESEEAKASIGQQLEAARANLESLG